LPGSAVANGSSFGNLSGNSTRTRPEAATAHIGERCKPFRKRKLLDHMKAKKQYHIFFESLAGAITIIVLGSFILIRGTKDKSEFTQLKGKIIYLDKTFQELPKRHQGKYRYLMIEGYSKTFELFIGTDPGDFKPKYEKVDDLRNGDEITVYFDDDADDERINRLIQYIDKDGVAYYIRNNMDKFGGIAFILSGILVGVWILYLKRKGTII